MAVGYVDQARDRKVRASCAAETLGVAPRTLRHWRRRTDAPPACRGRPCKTASPERRAEVRRFLREVCGPAVGLEAIRALFPDVPRCVLADLLRRYRRVWRRRYRQRGLRLTWRRPGAVWAIDFSEAPCLIDGVFRYLFAVRDLASHCQLLWRPVKAETAAEAIAALEDLFREHGPPLVIKCDNGSAFIADAFQALLARHGVLVLYSPPLHPAYNGAVERSNGVLKTYTQQHAVREQHPFRWTSDDVEAARQLANTLSRPWGHRRPTPDAAWRAREPNGDEARRAFQAAAARERVIAREQSGLPAAADLRREEQAHVDRLALPRVLAELGYLTMRRADRAIKPKRHTRADLAKRAAEDRRAPPLDDSDAQASAPPPGAPIDAAASTNAPPNKASPSAESEKWSAQLAAPMAADTMPPDVGVAASVHSGASPPAPAHVEPAQLSWFKRSIAPLFNNLKTAIISD
jgi:transposase InsO family protein